MASRASSRPPSVAAPASSARTYHSTRLGQRVARAGEVRQHQLERLPVGDLERREVCASELLGHPEQRHGGRDGRHRDPGGRVPWGGGEEPQHGPGDHAERALGPDEELGEVVAGVVLAQAAQPVPDPAVGQHHLEPEHELAGHPVAQHGGAAGVGGEVPPDGAAALGAERHGEEPTHLRRGRLRVGQHDTGVDRDGPGDRVDLADGPHPTQRQHHLRARRVRHAAAHQAGVAPLRHEGGAGIAAGPHDVRDLGRGAGSHHGQGPSGVDARPVDDVRRDVRILGQDVRGADGRAEVVEQVVHEGLLGGVLSRARRRRAAPPGARPGS